MTGLNPVQGPKRATPPEATTKLLLVRPADGVFSAYPFERAMAFLGDGRGLTLGLVGLGLHYHL
jgi:hypothetical protein